MSEVDDILDLGKIEVKVTREADGSYVKGRWVPGATTTFTIEVSVQPVRLQDKVRQQIKLPEGIRNRELIKLYGTADLRIAEEGTGKTADVVLYDGKMYEVFFVEKHRMEVLDHFKTIAVLKT